MGRSAESWQQEQENLSGNDYEEYYAEQMALPEHKRDGYAERMAERADIARDAMMDNLPF